MSTEHTSEFESPRADVIEHAQAAHSDLDTQLIAFFEEFRRVDLIYGAYGRRSGLLFSVYLIFDYIRENDGTSQREICATEEGERYRERMIAPLRQAEVRAMPTLEPAERRAMITYVDRFMNALEQQIDGIDA